MELDSGTLPNCASWFNINEINPIEKHSLTEFFCNALPSKTPEIYKEIRNRII